MYDSIVNTIDSQGGYHEAPRMYSQRLLTVSNLNVIPTKECASTEIGCEMSCATDSLAGPPNP